MNGTKLLDSLEFISLDLIEAADEPPIRQRVMWFKWGGLAACLCAITAVRTLKAPQGGPGGVIFPTGPSASPCVSAGPQESVGAPVDRPQERTSDTYSSLEELLGYLRFHDTHTSDPKGGASSRPKLTGKEGAGADSDWQTGRNVVSHEGTVYQIVKGDPLYNEKYVAIFHDGAETGRVELATPPEALYLSEGKLIVVGRRQNNMELDLDTEDAGTAVTVYDLSNPQKPVRTDVYHQRGAWAACWAANGKLWLVTLDGVCACGYSRLADLDDYKPQLVHNGEIIPWPEEDIRILGAPTRVSYVAAACIDVKASEVICKRAIYGDIEDVFYGPDWLALAASSTPEPGYTFQDVYTFDGSLTYTGRCRVAEDFGLEKTQTRPEDEEPEPPRPGQRPEIKAVSKAGTIWRIIGTIFLPDGSTWSRDLFAMTFDPDTGGTAGACLSLPEAQFDIDDVLWEEDRAIISAGFVRFDPFEQGARLAFAEFEDTGFGTSIDLFSSDILCDRVTGIENMYSYGSPLGWIHPFIPLSGGWYLRYNGTPNGFDIYDLSRNRNPVCIYKSEGDIPEGCRLDFDYRVLYSGGAASSVAVKLITPRDGDYRQPDYSWCIFSLDEEPPVVPRVSQERYPATGFDPASLAPIEP